MLTWRKRHLLAADAALACIVVLGLVGLALWFYTPAEVAEILNGSRATVYSTLASIAGSMLGFVLTAVSIIMVFTGLPRFKMLRESAQHHHVFQVFFCSIYALAVGTIVALIGLVFDTDAYPRPVVSVLALMAFAVNLMWVYRCIWILHQMAAIAATPLRETQPVQGH